MLKIHFILICALVLFVNCLNIQSRFVGVYESVSEAEWSAVIDLKTHERYVYTYESWNPGEYEKREIKQYEGSWHVKGNLVLLFNKSRYDTMKYIDSLSLDEIGLSGGAPGLVTYGKIMNESLIGDIKLWRLPHSFIDNK